MEFTTIAPSELIAILDLTRHMAERRMVAPLLEYIVDESLKLTGAQRGYVVLFSSNGVLDFRVTRDRVGDPVVDAEDQISRSVLEQVRTTQESLVLRDALNDVGFSHARSVRQLQLRSVMCVPLISYGTAIGAIYVENRSLQGRFKPEDVTPLVLFAHQAAISLENAEHNEQIEAHVATRTAELNQTVTKLQSAYARLEGLLNFARFMQHEVRGYAAGLEGLTPLLRQGFDGHAQRDHYMRRLDGLEETVAHMNDLTQRMLILSREGTLPIQQQQSVALQPLLAQVRSKALTYAERYELPLEIVLTCDPDVYVPCDALYLSLACYTGLRNAVEVLTEYEMYDHAQIAITVSQHKEYVQIRLSDNGPGFPAALLETIALAQQSAGGFVIGWSSKSGGSGLGLALMERVTQLHRGSLALGNHCTSPGAWIKMSFPHAGAS